MDRLRENLPAGDLIKVFNTPLFNGGLMKLKMARPKVLITCLALLFAVSFSMALGEEAKNTAATAGGAPSNPTVLILDASGSMWGQIEGQAKISIAKEVLKELINGLPVDLQVGLSVYGHRREGDCKDIEMLIPIGKLSAAAMIAKIDAITPKGKTPLSDAVRQAAEALRYTRQRATVVLVSDGLETCYADPCALAAELAKAGVDFKVHVIGFDISKEDQGRLRCLSDKTGGLFLVAADARSLREALFQTMTKVQEPPPPVVEDPGTANLKGPATVPAGSTFDVTWEGPDSRNDCIAIAAKGSKDNEYKDYAYTERGNPARIIAPGDPGQYELRYVHAHTSTVIGRADIQVTPVEASVNPPATSPAAGEFQVPWQGPSYEIDYITIAEPSSPAGSYDSYVYTRNGNPAKLKAPAEPGTYEIRYILGNGTLILAKAPIVIEEVSAHIQPPASAGAAAEFEVIWQGPANDGDYISIAEPSSPPWSYDNYSYTRHGNPVTLKAPAQPGTYEVRYIQAHGNRLLAKAPLTVQAVAAEVKPPPSVQAGATFEVAWEGPGYDGDYLTVAKPNDPASEYDNYAYTRNGNPAQLIAPSEPGDYEVRYVMEKETTQLAAAPFSVSAVSAWVKAPESVDAEADFEVQWEGPNYSGDYVTIVAADADASEYGSYAYTKHGSPSQLKAPEETGSYEVRYVMDRDRVILGRTPITVK